MMMMMMMTCLWAVINNCDRLLRAYWVVVLKTGRAFHDLLFGRPALPHLDVRIPLSD